MSAAKKTRGARSPRAATPDAARPWFAPKPRFYVAAIGYARVMRHSDQPFVVQKVATCDTPYQARQLARTLNREERARKTIIPRERCARFVAEGVAMRFRDVLRVLVDAVCAAREPVFGPRRTSPKLAGEQLAAAMVAAGRALGDEPTFAPGGEEVSR